MAPTNNTTEPLPESSPEQRALVLLDAIDESPRKPTFQESAFLHSFMIEHQETLDELTALVPRPSRTGHAKRATPGLNTQLTAARLLMRRCRELLARCGPCKTLPSELLAEIFCHIADADCCPDSWAGETPEIREMIALTHVCRLWRSAALHTRRLWNVLTIAADEWADASERVATWLERSGAAPLKITLEYNAAAADDFSALLRVLLRHMSRVTDLCTEDGSGPFSGRNIPGWNQLLVCLRKLLAKAPKLRNLFLDKPISHWILKMGDSGLNPSDSPIAGLARSGAKLTHLSIAQFGVENWEDHWEAAAALRTVDISSGVQVSALLELLRHSPRLQTLHVGYADGRLATPPTNAGTVVSASLQLLSLTAPNAASMLALLDALTLPALTTLELVSPRPILSASPAAVQPTLLGFLARSQCTLAILKLTNPTSPSRTYFADDAIVAVLQHAACAALEELDLGPGSRRRALNLKEVACSGVGGLDE